MFVGALLLTGFEDIVVEDIVVVSLFKFLTYPVASWCGAA